MINTEKLHPNLKNYLFRAAEMTDINTFKKAGWRILIKERGRGKKWMYGGDDNGPYMYEDEATCREDVRKLKAWAAS